MSHEIGSIRLHRLTYGLLRVVGGVLGADEQCRKETELFPADGDNDVIFRICKALARTVHKFIQFLTFVIIHNVEAVWK